MKIHKILLETHVFLLMLISHAKRCIYFKGFENETSSSIFYQDMTRNLLCKKIDVGIILSS
jgi:hypothetical protein